MLNVLSIASYQFLPSHFGGQKHIAIFNSFFSKYVHLTIVSTDNNETSLAQGYDLMAILPNKKSRYFNLFSFFTFRKIIREKKITHVVLEQPYFGWLGILLKWFCGVKLVVRSQNIESLRFKSMGKKWWPLLWVYELVVSHLCDVCFFITIEDLEYGVNEFKLSKNKCHVLTYGIDIDKLPTTEEKDAARKFLHNKHAIAPEDKVLLFNGSLNYSPNVNALIVILNKINPVLLANLNFKYKILICGKGLADEYNDLKEYSDKNIVYAGYVDDITIYYKGADLLLNPVIDGGGIKTKLVEALAYDLSVLSSKSGAFGVDPAICDGKLKVVADDDWDRFTNEIPLFESKTSDLEDFFKHFYWDNIAKKALQLMTQ